MSHTHSNDNMNNIIVDTADAKAGIKAIILMRVFILLLFFNMFSD